MIQSKSPACAIVVLFALGLAACGQGDTVPGRWYTHTQVEAGGPLFAQHCAVCHGEQAEATADWMRRDAQGNFPPPPLNGSAHAWHHPLEVLLTVIDQGGEPYGGVMPPFRDILSHDEKLAVV